MDHEPANLAKGRIELYNKLTSLVNKKLPKEQAVLVSEFIHQYYSAVALEDLQTHELMDLYGGMLSHWKLMMKRKPGETKISIFNPQFEQHGWQSTHTIIQIVHDDMPFLVDSIQMELNARGITTHMIIHVGGLMICRGENKEIKEILAPGQKKKGCVAEAPMLLEIDQQTDPKVLEELHDSILRILDDVRYTVEDWQKMIAQVDDSIEQLKKNPAPIDKLENDEAIEFLSWIKDNHFTFMGCRDYKLKKAKDDYELEVIPNSGLGVLRESGKKIPARSLIDLTPKARKLALSSHPLIIAKTNTRSTVHRPVYTDYIGVKLFNEKGEIMGERRFIGLNTSAAYNLNPKNIPLLRCKVQNVMKKSRLSRTGHAGKALLNILETFPRDDLFQADDDELLDISMGILHLQERRRTRLFVRKDTYGRYISCLIFVPRDRYNTELRREFQKVLEDKFQSLDASFATHFSESVLARIHFMLRIDPTVDLEYDVKEIEEKIIEVGRLWQDDIAEYIKEHNGEEKGNELISRYQFGFPAGYREATNARTAVYDIENLEKLVDKDSLAMSLFQPLDAPEGILRLKLYTLADPIPLSDVLPILENMGLRVIGEQAYRILRNGCSAVWINDFSMTCAKDYVRKIDEVKQIFQDAFAQVWFAKAENDGINNLVLSAKLNWREITILRAYKKYFQQAGFTFSQAYIEESLAKYPEIAGKLIRLFKIRFDPRLGSNVEKEVAVLEGELLKEFDAVESLDEDRILRHFHAAINATLRTNYFQTKEGEIKDYLSFKFDPEKIPDLPLPRPMFEIFVYSPRVEGVHLRSSKVARGGLRWSDRREDFRTEILGLMKAQKVKNSVIVPTGAKGGFVPKLLPVNESREKQMEEVISCYKTFICGLLDITDNLQAGAITHPENTVRYDGDDPYMVVAADKGTATFSDYANAVAIEYGHWLGDAFASGGETGYDHKKMGITAKGAWESVKRHFRELGLNTQKDPFTVVGIGDMAGDVFGNGMLLSDCIKLQVAFNHLHIFVDPDPDPKASFKERKRLFELPRSSWSDYKQKLISKGGGIFSRSAKSIPLSPEMKKMLDTSQSSMVPNELIRNLLKMKYDLLWNGGIGTFVKASYESNADAGDRTNDAIRMDGNEMQCRVIGEGGNLGLTQLGRVEYALHGGTIYTDFIDNSAGVDCSDHEVNIKILLNDVVLNGDMTEKQRNVLLAEMTDDVSKLVLRNNYWQTQALGIAAKSATAKADSLQRFIQLFEANGDLDREIEFLPDDKTLQERKSQGGGLTKPELSVLIAYSKMILKEKLLDPEVTDDPHLSKIIETAFPQKICKDFKSQAYSHNLRGEIIATQLANALVNDAGITFPYRTNEETGDSFAAIVKAYTVACEIFNMDHLRALVEELDYQVDASVQIEMLAAFGHMIRRATRWFLRNHRGMTDIAEIIELYKPQLQALHKQSEGFLAGAGREMLDKSMQHYIDAGVPEETAKLAAGSVGMPAVLDIIAAANEYKFEVFDVAKVYFTLGTSLDLTWLRWEILNAPITNHWESLARVAFRDDLDWQQRELAIGILLLSRNDKSVEEKIEFWIEAHKSMVERWHHMLSELRGTGSRNYTMYTVTVRGLIDLTQVSLQAVGKSEKKPVRHRDKVHE